jgi:hypothetical protein
VDERAFATLIEFLAKVPSVTGQIGTGGTDDGRWWVKFKIDIQHKLAWHAIQELGHVLNYLSLDERLPTSFYPVSPPPYMNGGPDEYLSWVIECHKSEFRPGTCAKWLSERLPKPVEDLSQWGDEPDS